MSVRIIAEQATHMLIGEGNQFAIVERRNNRLYNCHGGHRDGIPLEQISAVGTILDAADWMDEPAARAAFDELVVRGVQISQTLR